MFIALILAAGFLFVAALGFALMRASALADEMADELQDYVVDDSLEGDEITLQSEHKVRRWGFWNSRVIGENGNVYMRRISIITTPWFSIKLHRIYRPDQQRDLHDHPWWFVSFVLWGMYVEDVPHHCTPECCCTEETEPRVIRWFNWKRAIDRHSICWTSQPGPILSLVITGPVQRVWGFWTREGWVRWNEYEKVDRP